MIIIAIIIYFTEQNTPLHPPSRIFTLQATHTQHRPHLVLGAVEEYHWYFQPLILPERRPGDVAVLMAVQVTDQSLYVALLKLVCVIICHRLRIRNTVITGT